VDNLVMNVDRLAVGLEGQVDDINRPNHSRAEAARAHANQRLRAHSSALDMSQSQAYPLTSLHFN
jgi:hypothetical protein